MGPPSYLWSVTDRNVIMWHMTVLHLNTSLHSTMGCKQWRKFSEVLKHPAFGCHIACVFRNSKQSTFSFQLNTVLSRGRKEKQDPVLLSSELGAATENQELRNMLADTRTNLAVLRSEMAQLRTEYEEKCHEFNWFVWVIGKVLYISRCVSAWHMKCQTVRLWNVLTNLSMNLQYKISQNLTNGSWDFECRQTWQIDR